MVSRKCQFCLYLVRITFISLHFAGLFEHSHMKYERDRGDDEAGEPSIAEMTEKAIQILSKDEDGFFLFVEGQLNVDWVLSLPFPCIY